jgi:hypothetical protein
VTRLGRRHFLAALGLSAAWFAKGSARAGSPDPGKQPRPLRFIGVYTPHGRAHELWQPRPGFDIAYEGSILAAFDDEKTYGRSFKDRLLVLDGIDLSAGIAVGTTGHDAPRVILTGSGATGKNASVDQYLAVERGLGADTPHTSLVVGVGNAGSEIGSNISWAKGGTPVPKWIDPARVFDELFGAPLGKSGTELAHERKLQKSVLDHVRADLSALKRRAPASERVKLEQHHSALREIEKRLEPRSLDCTVPAPPDRGTFPSLRAYGGGERYFETISELLVDLVVRALACDLTRFSTIFLNDLSRTRLTTELPDDVHGDVAHRYDARTKTHPGTPESWEKLAVQNRHTSAQLARLLQRLNEAGLLDETLVYASGDMGDPARHSSRQVPTLIAGGTGGAFALGRYLDLRSTPDGSALGQPNNRVLVSICQAFGVSDQRYGQASDPKIVSGRLSPLYA